MRRIHVTMMVLLMIIGSQVQAMRGSGRRVTTSATQAGKAALEEAGLTVGQGVVEKGKGIARRGVQPMGTRSSAILRQQPTATRSTGLGVGATHSSYPLLPMGARQFSTSVPSMASEDDSPGLGDAYKQDKKQGIVTRESIPEKPWAKMTAQEKIIDLEERINEINATIKDGMTLDGRVQPREVVNSWRLRFQRDLEQELPDRYPSLQQALDDLKQGNLLTPDAKVSGGFVDNIEFLQMRVRLWERDLELWPKPGRPIGFDYRYLDLDRNERSRVLRITPLKEKIKYLIEKVHELPLSQEQLDDFFEKIHAWKKNVENGTFERESFGTSDKEREAFDKIHEYIHNHWFFINLQQFFPRPEGPFRPKWDMKAGGIAHDAGVAYEEEEVSGVKDYKEMTGQDIMSLDDRMLQRLFARDPKVYSYLAMKFHPDLSDEPDATNIMKKINAAYEPIKKSR